MLFRAGGPEDAYAVAALHADSWRHHYRGAYSDAYLDGDLVADRLDVWRDRLSGTDPRRNTIVAEEGGQIVGFAHVVVDEDSKWGSLLDNLHVDFDHKRLGIGRQLIGLAAGTVLQRAKTAGMYLWVLEQNKDAQAFYRSVGGIHVDTEPVGSPGGVPGRLIGSPNRQRYVWSDPSALASQ
jgi:GNAT superfamily N-acetyltransferase